MKAQTCSCAGAPLISSQSISSVSKGNILFGVTYEFHQIDNLYSGSDQLKNQTTERNTQSTLFEITYGLSNRFSISSTISYVRKQRVSGLQNTAANENLITNGIGDGLFLLKYVVHKNTIDQQYQLAIGSGVKVPFGKTSFRDDNGISLNADMQPGSGAWDSVFWLYYSKTFVPATSLNAFLYSTYRITGENKRFGSTDNYKFGNVFNINAGITNAIRDNFNYALVVQYRTSVSDQRNSRTLPNTGGKWLSIRPSLVYSFSRRVSFKAEGNIPFYQYLNGTQPTTSYSISGSIFFNLNQRIIF